MPINIRDRFREARFNRHEISGSLGDMGTFLPLLLGMTLTNGLDFSAGLFFAGFFNVVTGLLFGVPLAIQPMKAIAAIAITEGLTVSQILAAGICVGAIVFFLGLTGLVDRINRLIPKNVIRGIQLGLGLSLLLKGLRMVAETRALIGWNSYLIGISAALIVLLGARFKKIPAALLLFLGGILIAVFVHPGILTDLRFQWYLPHGVHLGWDDFVVAFPRAALPQIPLTLLNSVIAVCALSLDLFPSKKVPPKSVALSVGMMNLIAPWFGGMPMCHGAGGMAGQYRFGARTNGSILFLGFLEMAIAVFLGVSLVGLFQVFPSALLGVMLAFSGIGLSLVCRDQTARADIFVMLLTAGLSLALNNMSLGFIAGWLLALGLRKYYSGSFKTRNR